MNGPRQKTDLNFLKETSLFPAFRTSVPSLSWQMFGAQYKVAQKGRFRTTSLDPRTKKEETEE
eukprot:COSAG06_NODE_53352_length_300_cov_1.258706_1_plen_62_part_10